MSKLSKKEEKLAFKLLIPVFIVLIIVALYPLGHVFYTSFTDKGFARTQETNFVGLENYKRLLGISIKELKPLVNEETGEYLKDSETGEIIYERSINVLPKTPDFYREISRFKLFNKKYVVGAIKPDFILAIKDTIIFTLFAVFLETVLGMIIALVVNSKFKGRGLMRAAMLIPWAVTTVVAVRMWEWMFQSSRVGFFNIILDKLNLSNGQIPFLGIESLQLPSLIAVDVWKTTPFMALLILAGLQLIPKELYEAAEVDGSTRIYSFFNITLPLLRPMLAVALVFRTLDAIRVFGLFQIFLGQSRYSMASYTYYQLIGNRNMGLASAIGVIIFIFIFVFSIIYINLLGVDTK